MMLPSMPLVVLGGLEELPLRVASSLLTNDEMIDCAEAALVEDVLFEDEVEAEVDDVVPDVAEVLPVRLLSRF
jgi:hypothetical protein